ncbi:hypothetical protein M378DRAFT_172032 [Amanita muscaria Koide BX008]|uniref:Uncharacterized protein n=1 Tax=Amanita muscaria (strain Koide BX008) TaxID=946122 RepID=A0A0C2W7T2_AMAMK|nr:hypothetical protein M378DRAFT_172032 [Amanita muscaria Koide BX008]
MIVRELCAYSNQLNQTCQASAHVSRFTKQTWYTKLYCKPFDASGISKATAATLAQAPITANAPQAPLTALATAVSQAPPTALATAAASQARPAGLAQVPPTAAASQAPPATASDQAQSHPTTPTTTASQAPPTAPPQAPFTAVANKQPKRQSKDTYSTDDPMSTFEGDLTPQSSPAPKCAKRSGKTADKEENPKSAKEPKASIRK